MTVPAPDPAAPSPGPAPVSGVSHLQLVVGDVAVCRDWWTNVLGMQTLYEGDTGDVVALRHRPSNVVIVLSARAEGSAGAGDRLDHVAFAVPDRATLDTWVARLDELGIAHPGVIDELGNHSLQLVDPDGINVELVAPPDRP
ncbi:MAG: VOC family protein [Acidimicrobiales bacterium]|nr:VOC family protein [Acidimicrobiales bacterium]